MSKDPGLGGPLGGPCNILFPKKYNKKMYISNFLPQSGILNKSIIHIVFITMCMNVAKEPIFIYRWNIYFFNIFANIHVFINHVPHMTQDTCLKIKQILQFSAVVICDNQYDESLFFNWTKNSAHLKIMAPGLRGPAGGPCNSGDITGWGLKSQRIIIVMISDPCFHFIFVKVPEHYLIIKQLFKVSENFRLPAGTLRF